MELAVLLRNCKHAFGAANSVADATSPTNERYALKCDTFTIQMAKTPIQIPIPQQSPELIDLGIFRPSISIGGLVDTIGQDTSHTIYTAGTAAQSTTTVQGYNTAWTSSMLGSTVTFDSGGGGGTISAVNVGSQQLTVSTSATVNTGTYTILQSHYANMEYIDVSRRYFPDNSTYADKSNRYYIPYKNALEEIAYKWIASQDTALEIEIGDSNYTRYNRSAEPNSADPASTAISGTNNETGGGVYKVAIQQARFQVDPATEDRWSFQMQFVAEAREDVSFS